MNDGGVLNYFKSLFPFGNNKRTEGNTIPDLTQNEVSWIDAEINKYENFHQEDRKREDEAHLFYTALDYGQWPEGMRSTTGAKDLSQYNFVHRKINNGVGVVYKNPTDIDFAPMEGQYADLALVAKELFYADKWLMNWDGEYVDGLTDAFINSTMFRMTVNDSKNALGNLKLERLKPGHYLTDPEWDGQTMLDCNRVMTVSYMNPREIMSYFQESTPLIESKVLELAQGSNFQTRQTNHSITEYDLSKIYGQKYRVITYHHIEEEKSITRVALDFFGRAIDVPTPPEDIKNQAAANEWVNNWLEYNKIDKGSVLEREVIEKVYYVTTVCADLSPETPLESRKGYIQAGRLPFFNLSFSRHNGRNLGMVDLMKDAQQNFNQRMSLISEILAKSAKDAWLFEPNAFGNDPQKIKEVKEEMAMPGFRMDADPGYIESGAKVFAEVPKAPYPALEQNNANMQMELMDSITPLNPANEGRNESSKETGVLFERKREQGEINLTTVNMAIETFWEEVGSVYIYGARTLYSGAYRSIQKSADGDILELNRPDVSPDGKVYTSNNIADLPPCKVVVTRSPAGITQRVNDRISSVELIRVLPQEAVVSKMALFQKVIKTLDNYTAQERAEFDELLELEKQVIVSGLEAQVSNNQMTKAQAEQMLQQIQNPPPPDAQIGPDGQPVVPGGEPPVPGAEAQTQPVGPESGPVRTAEQVGL